MSGVTKNEEKQLGDFIRGRLLFVDRLCEERGLDKRATLAQIREESLRLAGSPERKAFLDHRVFKGVILSTSLLPDWLDKVLLEAISHVLKGPEAALFTSSSDESCIPFEAGRFNAHRQADTVFKMLYQGKSPEEWLSKNFRILYQKCYGDEALKGLKIERRSANEYLISMDNRHLEKGSPMDCSTILGYLYGSLEKLGAKGIKVKHVRCSTVDGSPHPVCEFVVHWAA
jgi:hypothetical protein